MSVWVCWIWVFDRQIDLICCLKKFKGRFFFWYSPAILNYQYIPSCLLFLGFLSDVCFSFNYMLCIWKVLVTHNLLMIFFLLFHYFYYYYILYRISDCSLLVQLCFFLNNFFLSTVTIEIHSLVWCLFLCFFCTHHSSLL